MEENDEKRKYDSGLFHKVLVHNVLLGRHLRHAGQSCAATFLPSPTPLATEMCVFAGLEGLRAETADFFFYHQLGQIGAVLALVVTGPKNSTQRQQLIHLVKQCSRYIYIYIFNSRALRNIMMNESFKVKPKSFQTIKSNDF